MFGAVGPAAGWICGPISRFVGFSISPVTVTRLFVFLLSRKKVYST